ncbi:ATP-dependent metallopeptidase FtsH/Yme1/Tma family protein, partial [Ectothiorhodospira lacustris]
MNELVKNLIIWAVIAIVLMSVFNNFSPTQPQPQAWSYSEFLSEVKAGRINSVYIEDKTIQGRTIGGERFNTYAPNDPGLIGDLLASNVEIRVEEPARRSLLMDILISWFPMLLLIGVWIYFMRQMQGGAGGRGAMSFGK